MLPSAVVICLLMDHSPDTNADIWHSGEAVEAWAAEAQAQERNRAAHRRFMATLLPFGPQRSSRSWIWGRGPGPRRVRSLTCIRAAPRYSRIFPLR